MGSLGGSAGTLGKIFGVPLSETMTIQRRVHPELKVPVFLHDGFRYIIQHGLEIEGIFRIAGTKERVRALQQQLDRGEAIDFAAGRVDPVDLADLIKIYFRELPDCLLQADHYDAFIATLTHDRLGQIQKLRELVADLATDNQDMLRELVWFLGKIAINHSYNKMTAENLGLVFGPNLLWKGGKAISTTDMMELMAGAGKIKLLVTLLVEEQDHIFNHMNDDMTHGDIKVAFVYKLGGYKKTCQGIAIMEDSESRSIWTADSAGTLRIYNAETYETEREMDSKLGRIFTMTSLRDRAWIASSTSVSVWTRAGVMVKEFPGFHVSLAPVYSHGELQIWAGTEQKITVFSSVSLEIVQTIALPPGQFIVSIAEIYGDSNQVWAGATNGTIYVFDKTTGAVLHEIKTPARRNITCLTYHAYMGVEGRVWAGSEDKMVFIIDPTDYSVTQTIQNNEMLMLNALKSVSNSIWSCSRDSVIRMWDSATYECKGQLDTFHTDAVIDAVFSWNSRKLRWEFWSASFDKTVCIWSVSAESLPPPPPQPF
eukprot:gene9774-11413_t